VRRNCNIDRPEPVLVSVEERRPCRIFGRRGGGVVVHDDDGTEASLRSVPRDVRAMLG
jgi:hypothetical protein